MLSQVRAAARTLIAARAECRLSVQGSRRQARVGLVVVSGCG